VSAVGHYLEEEGIATVSISLVREHTAVIRPPRALWVPFMLGRPLGAPNDAAFQRDVLTAALALFEERTGPVVLRDFDREAPDDAWYPGEEEGLACPVSFSSPAPDPESAEGLAAALLEEIAQLRPWQDLAVRRRGGTSVALSGLSIEAIGQALCEFIAPPAGAGTAPGTLDARALKFACDDLRAFYEEAASAQPGQMDASRIQEWMYGRTVAGKVLQAVRERAEGSGDPAMRLIGSLTLIPRSITHARR
jgi:hypothetical protein